MELILVFALNAAPDLEDWSAALEKHNIPVTITVATDLKTHSGFLPMSLSGKETGLYFHIDNYNELATQIPQFNDIDIEKPVVYWLSYGGHFDEGAVVFYSGAALLTEFGGYAFETQGGTFLSAEQLLEAGRSFEQIHSEQ